jgi:hypothetical protein
MDDVLYGERKRQRNAAAAAVESHLKALSVGIKKKQTVIAPADVPHVFNETCIGELAAIGRLPNGANSQRFGEGIREAACIYAKDARNPAVGTIRDEIDALHSAAKNRRYEPAAMLLSELSRQARAHLEARLKLPGPRAARLRLPSVEDLRNPGQRDEASEMIRRLCSAGGHYIEGRKRSSGKRSKTWQPKLFAPEPLENPPKLDAERQFVMHLRLAWLEAVGKPPTATVNPSRPDRPFANLVKKCLKLVGAHADAVGLINELHRRKLQVRKRLADLRRNQRRMASEVKKAF